MRCKTLNTLIGLSFGAKCSADRNILAALMLSVYKFISVVLLTSSGSVSDICSSTEFNTYQIVPGGQSLVPTGQSFLEFADNFYPKLAAAHLEPPETENSTFCDQCAAITFSKLKEPHGYMLFDDILKLENSATKCDMCQLTLLLCG
jgi:hypothetical protein